MCVHRCAMFAAIGGRGLFDERDAEIVRKKYFVDEAG